MVILLSDNGGLLSKIKNVCCLEYKASCRGAGGCTLCPSYAAGRGISNERVSEDKASADDVGRVK